MKIVYLLFLQLAVPGAPGAMPHNGLNSQVQWNTDSPVNRIYLGIKNRLYFDSTKIKILAILPGADLGVNIQPGYLELLPRKSGADRFKVKTDRGTRTIDYAAQPLPDNKTEAARMTGERRSLIMR